MNALRRSASQLFHTPKTVHVTSALAHLGKRRQFILALDGPGIPQDPWAYPLAWSSNNVIAVACGPDVYYQNLDTRQIAHLCSLQRPTMGRIRALEFARGDRSNLLCMGTTTGSVQIWDAETRQRVRQWPNTDWMGLTAISWKGHEFMAGRNDGKLLLYDSRTEDAVHKLSGHKGDVYGLQWSTDERFLASSDRKGIVHVWDARNMRSENTKWFAKMKHRSPVKVRVCPHPRSFFAQTLCPLHQGFVLVPLET